MLRVIIPQLSLLSGSGTSLGVEVFLGLEFSTFKVGGLGPKGLGHLPAVVSGLGCRA